MRMIPPRRPEPRRSPGRPRILLVLMLLALVAVACRAPAEDQPPSLTLSAESAPAGAMLTVSGQAFPGEQAGQLLWSENPAGMPVVRTGRDGSFRMQLPVPALPPGDYEIRATAAGATARAPFSIADPPAAPPPAPLARNQLVSPTFESSPTGNWYDPWGFTVEASGRARGVLVQDTGYDGMKGARVDVSAADSNRSHAWHIRLFQGHLRVTAGVPVTVTFWARASKDRVFTLGINQNYPPYQTYESSPDIVLTTAWQRHTYTFTPTVSDTNATLAFALAQDTGSVWLDEVSFAESSAPPAPTPEPAGQGPPTVYLGVTNHPAPWDMSAIDAFERDTGREVAIISYFLDFEEGTLPGRELLAAIQERGAVPMITWEWLHTDLAGVLSGAYDAEVRRWAREFTAHGGPVLLRWGHEMNGLGWYPWGVSLGGQTAEQFIAAWRHLRGIFRAEGADNVQWVWSPNIREADATDFTDLYPGDEHVDWIALDGYNYATKYPWRTFTALFEDSYHAITALTQKPLMLAEWGSTEAGGDKGAWLRAALGTDIPTRFPRIKAVVYFNQLFDEDWRVTTSEGARQGYADGVAAPVYRDTWP